MLSPLLTLRLDPELDTAPWVAPLSRWLHDHGGRNDVAKAREQGCLAARLERGASVVVEADAEAVVVGACADLGRGLWKKWWLVVECLSATMYGQTRGGGNGG